MLAPYEFFTMLHHISTYAKELLDGQKVKKEKGEKTIKI